MQEEALIATGALVVKKTAFASSLLTGMVIFQDPTYVIISMIGAFVSMGSAFYDFNTLKKEREDKKEKCLKSVWMELSKAFIIGSLITILSFMLFTGITREGFTSLNIIWLSEMLPSFWFIVTLMLATEAVTIWDKVKEKIKGWAL